MENQKKYSCPFCNSSASIKDSEIIYKKSYGPVLICDRYPECDAFVSVHKTGNVSPMGTMANKELRELRKECHNKYFDPLWKHGHMTRKDAYKYFQAKMNLTKDQAHIAMLDKSQVERFIEILKIENDGSFYN